MMMEFYGAKPILSVVVPMKASLQINPKLIDWLSEIRDHPLEVTIVIDTLDDSLFYSNAEAIGKDSKSVPRIIRSRHLSPGLTRNEGIPQCNGKWIAFWDSDDVPNLKVVFELIKIAEQLDLDYILGLFEEIEGSSKEHTQIESISQNWKFDVAVNPGIWRFIFRRDSITDLKFSNLSLGEDQQYLLNYEYHSRKGARVRTVSYGYSVGNPDQQTSSSRKLEPLQNLIEESLNRDSQDNESIQILAIFFTRQLFTLVKIGLQQHQLITVFKVITSDKSKLVKMTRKLILGSGLLFSRALNLNRSGRS